MSALLTFWTSDQYPRKNWKKKPFSLIAVLLLFAAASYPQNKDIPSRSNSFSFPEFFICSLPGAGFYPAFFENFAPDATYLIEESNGFSLIDSPRVYYEGDSFIQFNWFYEGFNINSALDDGSPGILLPFSAISQYALRGESPSARDHGFHFISGPWDRSFSRIRISATDSNLGGYLPWAQDMVKPHASSAGRDAFLYSPRRKILSNYDLDYIFSKKAKSAAFSLSLTAFDVRRQFNDFNVFNETYREKGQALLLAANYEKKLKDGSLVLTGVVNDLSRDHFLAELGRYPQETQQKDRQSFFTGIRLNKKNLTVGLSYLLEKENLAPSVMNFLKDLKDNDGEGLFPFEKWGSFSAHVFRLSADLRVLSAERDKKTGIDFFSEFKSAFLIGSENAFEASPLSFGGVSEYVILWNKGQPYRNVNLDFKIGALLSHKLSRQITVMAKVLLQNSAVRFQGGNNNLSLLAPGFDLGLLLFRNPEILVSYEQMPYELRENVNFFLEKRRPWGILYRWADANGDLRYQNGEQGEVFGYTGGRFHAPAEDLKIPVKRRLLISLSSSLSKNFILSLKGLIKKIDDNLWVRFKEDYGFYENLDNTTLYFFDKPFEDYVLGNDPFSKKPFYAQLLLQINSRENKKWFFSFSFLAHIGMGRTAFGNGAGANDIGLLSESQANPNSLVNAYGRVDGDRAYVGKLFFGAFLAKNLFLGVSLKYRDGTPFAFLDSVERNNQLVMTYKTIKAENEQGLKGGPRKDYLSDVSLKLRYQFKLFKWEAEAELSVFNLLDFGSELSEYAFSGGRRYANELQIPRSLRLGLSVEF